MYLIWLLVIIVVLNWPAFFHQSSTRDWFWLEWWREHEGARASYLKMSYCWADCGSDWKEEMEWITAAVGGSGIMSQSGDCVVHTVRCGCMALIHTLPCMHRTWEDICPPLLSGSGRSVWNHISTHSHTEVWTTPIPLLSSTQAVVSLPQRQVVLTEVCCWGRTLL